MATLGGQLTLNARRHPDRPALIFEGVERSYGQLDREINQYANALLSLGVQKGDRVAVLSPNSDRFLLALYGAFKVGAIVSPFNPRSTARELAYLLEDSGASVLLFVGTPSRRCGTWPSWSRRPLPRRFRWTARTASTISSSWRPPCRTATHRSRCARTTTA